MLGRWRRNKGDYRNQKAMDRENEEKMGGKDSDGEIWGTKGYVSINKNRCKEWVWESATNEGSNGDGADGANDGKGNAPVAITRAMHPWDRAPAN